MLAVPYTINSNRPTFCIDGRPPPLFKVPTIANTYTPGMYVLSGYVVSFGSRSLDGTVIIKKM